MELGATHTDQQVCIHQPEKERHASYNKKTCKQSLRGSEKVISLEVSVQRTASEW